MASVSLANSQHGVHFCNIREARRNRRMLVLGYVTIALSHFQNSEKYTLNAQFLRKWLIPVVHLLCFRITEAEI